MATQIDLGAVVPIGKGDWNGGTTYERANIVRHNSVAWICKVDSSIGVEPTESSSDWYLLVKDTSSVTSVNGQRGDVNLDLITSEEVDSKISNLESTINSKLPNIMVGASDEENGVSGLVPKPNAGDNKKFLKGDGKWSDISSLVKFGNAFAVFNALTNTINSTIKSVAIHPNKLVEGGVYKIDGTVDVSWGVPGIDSILIVYGADGNKNGTANTEPVIKACYQIIFSKVVSTSDFFISGRGWSTTNKTWQTWNKFANYNQASEMLASGGNTANKMKFTYADPGGCPPHIWGAKSLGESYVYHVNNLTIGRANVASMVDGVQFLSRTNSGNLALPAYGTWAGIAVSIPSESSQLSVHVFREAGGYNYRFYNSGGYILAIRVG